MSKVTSLIWEMIEESFKAEEEKYYQDLQEYHMSYIDPMLESNFGTMKEYLINKYGEKEYGYSPEINFAFKLLDEKNNSIIKRENFDIILDNIIRYQIEKRKWKLQYAVFSTLAGVDIVECRKIFFFNREKGFQGEWAFTTKDGEKAVFETKSVYVNGPIKEEHYRYISHIIGNTNIKSDRRVRNEILLVLKKEDPDYKKQLTPEEKELKKRIEKAKSAVKNSQWYYDHNLENIQRDEKQLQNMDNIKEDCRESYKQELIFRVAGNKDTLLIQKKRIDKAQADLETVENTNLDDISKEIQLKKDKKRIKELKEYNYSGTLSRLKTKDPNAYEIELEKIKNELSSLFDKYPDLKKKDIKSKIKNQNEIIYWAKIYLNNDKNTQENIDMNKRDIKEAEEKLKVLQAELEKLLVC